MNGKRAKSLRRMARTIKTNEGLQQVLTPAAQQREVRMNRRGRTYAMYPTAAPSSVYRMVKELYTKGMIFVGKPK
jgi:hypothetical protein